MTKERIINDLKQNASSHRYDEVMYCIAGYREDNGKDYYTWGEFLDALNTRKGYVWEHSAKTTIDLIYNHPEIFDR